MVFSKYAWRTLRVDNDPYNGRSKQLPGSPPGAALRGGLVDYAPPPLLQRQKLSPTNLSILYTLWLKWQLEEWDLKFLGGAWAEFGFYPWGC